MNNGAYSSQDAAVLGPKIEEVVRADLGASTPVPFEVIGGDGKTMNAGTMLADTAKYIFGGKEAVLMTVAFDIEQPRPISLQVCLNRQGVGAHIGSVLYKAKIAKPITGEVTLEDPKMLGTSKFVGDSTAAAKLNANKDLLKRAGKFARTESPNLKVKAPRFFQVKPEDGAATITAASLARSYAMGLKVSLDVQEFIEIVGLIEASL
jgi:hypothetical protein